MLNFPRKEEGENERMEGERREKTGREEGNEGGKKEEEKCKG